MTDAKVPGAPQLSLFSAAVVAPRVKAVRAAPPDPRDVALAGRLPASIRLGTSSWSFPGWGNGLVYEAEPSAVDLAREGLAAYARHPLFRTVGIDRSYYRPLTTAELEAYAGQLPDGFLAVSKAWDEITTAVFPNHPRLGAKQGAKNDLFLDPEAALHAVVAPLESAFAAHTGPVVFEIPPLPPSIVSEDEFLTKLDRLLAAVAHRVPVAIEVRHPPWLGPEYVAVLRAHGAGHVFNFWSRMPRIRRQLELPGLASTAPFIVTRLMLPPGRSYEGQRERFAPFHQLVDPQEGMRADVVALARLSEALGKPLYVLVNNKAEGSSPLTVRALAERITDDLDRRRAE